MSKSKENYGTNSIQILNYLYYSQSESKLNSADSKVSNRNNHYILINKNTGNRNCLNFRKVIPQKESTFSKYLRESLIWSILKNISLSGSLF